MTKNNAISAFILGGLLCLGMVLLGNTIGDKLIKMKSMERTVTVKGLAEKEVRANIAIWPIRFTEVDNDLDSLYQNVQTKTDIVAAFLKQQGFDDVFCRMWDYYLAYCEGGFRERAISTGQFVFAKPRYRFPRR